MLTHKQRALLIFIHERLTETGIPPSFEEMKDELQLKSKSGIHRLIGALEERGFIKRLAHRARAVEVLRLPDDIQNSMPSAGQTPSGPTIPGLSPDLGDTASNAAQLPLLGRVVAGLPIDAFTEVDRYVEVPSHLYGRGEHFVLEVDGDSMMEAGILDGDLVIIQKCHQAYNGDIVVAIIDNKEVTLKRWRQHDKFVALEPANSQFETTVVEPERVMVQGRLRGLMRNYS